MIRNNKEYEVSKRRAAGLGEEISSREKWDEDSKNATGVISALEMQVEDIRLEIGQYEMLQSGIFHNLNANGIDELGELVVKARIAQGLTQEQLGVKLGMTQQQVQRYERDGYQKISLWQLAEIADVLGLDINSRLG